MLGLHGGRLFSTVTIRGFYLGNPVSSHKNLHGWVFGNCLSRSMSDLAIHSAHLPVKQLDSASSHMHHQSQQYQNQAVDGSN